MRNVPVVLVLSCIGLSCGFIVPSGIEIIADLNKSSNSIQNSKSKPRNMIKNNKTNIDSANITSELSTKIHKSCNHSLDNDLYDDSNAKDAPIEERSFIYIKQRGKTPYLKNVYELIPKRNFDNRALKSYVITHPILDDIARRFLTDKIDDKYLKLKNLINFHTDTEPYQHIEKNSNQPGKYFEQLKDPMLRPIVKTNEKDFITMEKSLFNFTVGRKLLTNTQQSLMSKNDFYLKNRHKTTEINYDRGQTVSDDINENNLNQIIKKLLEKYILDRKSNYLDHTGFQFCRNCLKKAKHTINSRLETDSSCKCGRQRLVKTMLDDINN